MSKASDSQRAGVFDNPLLEPIADLLQASGGVALSEYTLLGQLVEAGYLEAQYSEDNLALFQTHFLAMNALYQLQRCYCASGGWLLIISPLCIALEPRLREAESARGVALEVDSMAAYYLDWDNFSSASQDSVAGLLNSFWQRYLCQDKWLAALTLLDLDESARWPAVKQRYRQLAMEWHPDRGGDHSSFTRLQAAFALLKAHFARTS